MRFYGSEYDHIFPAKSGFLKTFVFNRNRLKLPEEAFFEADSCIESNAALESSELEHFLIRQSEASASRATATIEGTNTIGAADTERIIASLDQGEDPVTGSLAEEQYNGRELANIVKAFREINARVLSADNLSIDLLKSLHVILSEGLDSIGAGLNGYTKYNSGRLRVSDEVMVGDYQPVQAAEIKKEIEFAFQYLRGKRSVADVFNFSLAIYAIHPFHNGNKRLCRVLEHALLRSIGLNKANMYSHITALYSDPNRFFRHLISSLTNRVCNLYVESQMDALFYSQLGALRATVEYQRDRFLSQHLPGKQKKHDREIAGLFVHNKILQFKDIKEKYLVGGKPLNNKTLSESLDRLKEYDILLKKGERRGGYYSLNYHSPVEDDVLALYRKYRLKTNYEPTDLLSSVVRGSELFPP